MVSDKDRAANPEYRKPCKGCPDGHPTFWKTVVESPQWIAWEKQIAKNFHKANVMLDSGKEWPSADYQEKKLPIYDVDECRECNVISPKHFQAFLRFCKKFRP